MPRESHTNDASNHTQRMWATIAMLAWLILLLVGSRLGTERAWGFNHLAFLPPLAYWITTILALLTLAIIWTRTDVRLWRVLDAQPSTLVLIAALSVWVVVAVGLHTSTPLLGDGFLRIDETISRPLSAVVLTEILPSFLSSFAFRTLGLNFGWSAQAVLAGISVSSGVLLLIGCFWLWPKATQAYENTTDPSSSSFGLLCLLSGGWVILFFGYYELYALSATALILFTLSLIAHMNRKLHWAWPVVLWTIAVWSHLMTIAWAPVLILVLYMSTNQQSDRVRRVSTAIVAIVLSLLVIRSLEDSGMAFSLGNYVLPLTGDGYSLFDLRHLVDILNLLILLFPAVIATLWPWKRQTVRLDVRDVWIAVPSTFFWLIFNVTLGWARDWDLLATAALPMFVVLIVRLSGHVASVASTARRTAALGIALSSLLLWALINSNSEASVTRFSTILDTDNHCGSSGSETLARYWREQGDWERAVAELGRGLALEPHPRLLIQRGIGFSYLDQSDSALTAFRAAVALAPDNPDALYGAGQTLFGKGQPQDALPYLERADAIDSTRSDFKYYLGQALCNLGRYDDGLPHLAAATRLKPDVPMLTNDYAAALFASGNVDEATRVLESMTRRYPSFPVGHVNLAWVYWNVGDTSAAVSALERYERLIPATERQPIASSMRFTLDSIQQTRDRYPE